MDTRWVVLGMKDIFDRPVNEVISLGESKKMARYALPEFSAGISSSTLFRHTVSDPLIPQAGSQSDWNLPRL